MPVRAVWRAVGPRFVRHGIGLVVFAIATSVVVWGAEGARRRAAQRVWGADLAAWVGRLEAAEPAIRDSAVLAVGTLVGRAWRDVGGPSDPPGVGRGTKRSFDTVLAALTAATRRLADADSAVRERAVSVVLDVTEGDIATDHRVNPTEADTARSGPLRAAVRRTAGDVLRAAARVPRQPGVERAALEVLATIGVPVELLPLVDEIAARDASTAVRALATTLALRPSSSPGDAPRRRAMVRVLVADPSSEVRLAVVEALVHDPALLCADDARHHADGLRRDPDPAVRTAIATFRTSSDSQRTTEGRGSCADR